MFLMKDCSQMRSSPASLPIFSCDDLSLSLTKVHGKELKIIVARQQ